MRTTFDYVEGGASSLCSCLYVTSCAAITPPTLGRAYDVCPHTLDLWVGALLFACLVICMFLILQLVCVSRIRDVVLRYMCTLGGYIGAERGRETEG